MKKTGMLAGKVAIVTGGAGSIGRAVAVMMGAEGAQVVVNDIGASLDGMGNDTGPAHKVAEEITRAGGDAIACTLSITDPKGAEGIVAAAREAFGRVDIVVNNAGILRDAMFHKMSGADWRDVLDVHLNGSFNLSRAAAPFLREQNGGAFVHMTSTSGLIGQVGQANYAAAKMGIVGLSRSIALDLQRFNVRSNCIAPFAWSRMISSIPTDTPEQKARVEKLQQMKPEKVASMAVFLASDSAEGISGQIFAVRNNEIILMSQPRPIRSVHHSEGWTPSLLNEIMKPAMMPSLVPLEVSGQVFTWDPI